MRRNFNILFIAFGALLAGIAAAQERAVIPNFFDPQDRFEAPDLTDLARLRFLTVTDFPPFSYVDSEKQLVGYHVELARAICDRLALEEKCEIQALPFAELEKALTDGEGEALLAGIAVTAGTRERLAFTRPYFRLPARFVARRGVALEDALASGLDGRSVAVRKGTAHEAYLARFFPAAAAKPFETDDAALAALEAGEADLLFSDALRLSQVLAGPKGAALRFVGGPYGDPAYFGRGLAIAVRPEDDVLLQALNHALVALNEKRVLEELYLRHFPIGLY